MPQTNPVRTGDFLNIILVCHIDEMILLTISNNIVIINTILNVVVHWLIFFRVACQIAPKAKLKAAIIKNPNAQRISAPEITVFCFLLISVWPLVMTWPLFEYKLIFKIILKNQTMKRYYLFCLTPFLFFNSFKDFNS